MAGRIEKYLPFRSIMIPILTDEAQKGFAGEDALAAADLLKAQIILVGIVTIPEGASLSKGAARARSLRSLLRKLAAHHDRVVQKIRVIVSHTPWQDLNALIQNREPDLLLLEWDRHFASLGVNPVEILHHPPCNLALLKGRFTSSLDRVLLPLRGGPHAELALRFALGLRPKSSLVLHLTPGDGGKPFSDAPFRGLARVLGQLTDVKTDYKKTTNPARTILNSARQADLIIMGMPAQTEEKSPALGLVVYRIFKKSMVPVIAVKTRKPLRVDESAGTEAISILVDKWFAQNTFHADEFSQLSQLADLKQKQGVSISLALLALNEEATIGSVIKSIKSALMEDVHLLDEIVVVDSNSQDRTRDIARRLDIPVYIHQNILPALGPRTGKGEALWKSLYVTRGDIVVWIDTDIANIHPRFVYGIIGPLLQEPEIQFVKGFYRRPLKEGGKIQAGGGGRVTELMARPLINLFYPELSGLIQPLAGEYAARRSALERFPFYSGYGVEIGLLIDVFETYGLNGIAQVDLMERVHRNQPLDVLGKMSFAIVQAVMGKLEQRFGRAILEDVNKSMKLIHADRFGYYLDIEEIAERQRPAMIGVSGYWNAPGRTKRTPKKRTPS